MADYFEDVGIFYLVRNCLQSPPPEGMITSAYLSVFFFDLIEFSELVACPNGKV